MRNFNRVVLFGLVTFFFLFGSSIRGHAQSSATTHPKLKKHTTAKASPQIAPVQTPLPKDMPRVHIVPYGTPTKLVLPPTSSAGGLFSYWGGPVISNVHVVEVLWGNFVDAPSTTGLPQFLTDVVNSNYFDLLSEYGTVGVPGQAGGAGSNQLIGRGVFDGKFVIAPSLCPGSATNPPPTCSITDTQIQAELTKQQPHLPAPVMDKQGNYNTIYLFYFPPGVHISLGGAPSCAPGGFCAYHGSIAGSLPAEIPYGVFPDFGPNSGCSAAQQHCGRSTSANNLSSATSHEIGEAVTDENIANANNLAPPLAWYDPNVDINGNTIGEIGDICNQQQQQISVAGHTYTVQAQWSNMQNGCVIAPAQIVLTGPTSVVPGMAFNLDVSVSSSTGGLASQYSNTVHFTSSDAQAVLPADYTFNPGTDLGTHTFSLTLNSLNSQTVTATDTLAAPITATANFNVKHNPDLALAKTHSGNFTQGQNGARYTLTVSNTGDRPTTGTVTVVDTLPPDLTATAMTGTGWTCSPGVLTCTRADVLAAGASYPAITLTTMVSNTAPPSIINTATVSGGGEVNFSNDQASDPTTVTQLPDLTISVVDSANFSQGGTGVIYALNVGNVSSVQSIGTVSVTDTLPTGLTATAISGPSWNCVLATLHCTTSGPILPGFYPSIQITADIALNAPSSVTNTATVSGGGEVITTNDTGSDTTAVSGPVADFTVKSTHTGNFTQGQIGAVYTLTASNVGPGASVGTVFVTEQPSQMVVTAITGSGWACPFPSLTCSRNDALPPGSSYPPITVTGNILTNASAVDPNSVLVQGGGEINTANDSDTDNATVIQIPDLIVTSFHPGNFTQGQIGATYTLSALNNGGKITTGTITLVDTLPAGLTATSISGTNWNCALATLTCTTNDQLTYGSNPITLTVNVDPNAPASVTNTVTVSGGGETVTTDNTATDVTTILPPIFLTSFPPNNTVTAGQPVTYSISITSVAPNPVVLACTGLPTLATCSFNPPTATGQNASSTLTITTTAPTRSAAGLWNKNGAAPLYAMLLPLLGFFVTLRAKAKTKLAVSATLLALVFLGACGGGGTTAPPPPPTLHGGTPAGTYKITVTATDSAASLQGSTTLQLNVNWNGL